jgi:hypothetical protein
VKGTEKNIWKGLRMVFERYTENRKWQEIRTRNERNP